MIIQGLHLIFDFQESKYPNFSTKMKFFVPKMKFSIPKRDKYTKLDKKYCLKEQIWAEKWVQNGHF